MRLIVLLLAALLPLAAPARAQAPPAAPTPGKVTGVKGRLVDPTTNQGVPAALVKMTSLADTTDVAKASTRDDGTFEIAGLGIRGYRLEASRVGYATLRLVLSVTDTSQNLGLLPMTPEAVNIPGVTVTESPPVAAQIADTTEFRASAVKTSKDASAEELVQKLPGMIIEKGKLKAQGEEVKQVLVNGKPFFGSDPTAALRNLPAEVVDRIQVYDKASDQAEFSGFDDGDQQKTLNFILRDQKSAFGKVYGGYGDRDLYQAGGNYTRLNGSTRLTLIGISNNINQSNFAAQDLFGAQSSTKSLVNQQGGLSTTNSGGTNYVADWGRLEASASLFLNEVDNLNTTALNREYLPPQDS